MTSATSSSRRSFVSRLVGAAAVLAGTPALASASPSAVSGDVADAWITALKGKHKQLFHAFEAKDGRALEQARAFLDIYPTAYGVKETELNAVVAAHGYMLGMLLSDATWKKYGLGEYGKFTDPRTKTAAVRNIYLTEGDGETMEAGTSVTSLMKRGVTFLACNNALTGFSYMLAGRTKQEQPAVYKELRDSLVPGSVVVPAMIIAISRAQEHGVTYIYSG